MNKRKIIDVCRAIEFWSLAVLLAFLAAIGMAKGVETFGKEERIQKIDVRDFCNFLKDQGAPGCFTCRGKMTVPPGHLSNL